MYGYAHNRSDVLYLGYAHSTTEILKTMNGTTCGPDSHAFWCSSAYSVLCTEDVYEYDLV